MANLLFRQSVIEQCERDAEFAADIFQMCRDDIVFFVNVFGWVSEPRDRNKDLRDLPFITWPKQEELFDMLRETYAMEHCGTEKTRDVGATWIHIWDIVHSFIFDSHSSHLMVSSKYDYIWQPDDEDALFSKLDYALGHLHSCVRPRVKKREARYYNPDNRAVVVGEASVENVGRSGRKTTAFCDELAHNPEARGMMRALQAVTNSLRGVSTPAGPYGTWYDFIKTVRRKVTFRWTDDPRKLEGLYRATSEGVEFLDTEYEHGPNYQFVRDGTVRSPWLDYQEFEKYKSDKRGFMQEVMLSYEGSVALFYGAALVERVINEDVREPLYRGEISFLTDTGEFRGFKKDRNGRCLLWCNSDPHEAMPKDRSYVVGVDISAGAEASNSVIVVLDCMTSQKVFEFADPNILPHELAPMSIAVCQWFAGNDDGAYLIWDDGGSVASSYRRGIVGKYGRIHYRISNEKSVNSRETDVPGFIINNQTGPVLHAELRRSLLAGEYIERSEACAQEMLQYLHGAGMQVVHSRAMTTDDMSGAKQNHGDRVIATMLALRGREAIGATVQQQAALQTQPKTSYALRNLLAQRNARRGSNVVRSMFNGVNVRAHFNRN